MYTNIMNTNTDPMVNDNPIKYSEDVIDVDTL